MEEKSNFPSSSQADIAKLSKEAADLLENEVNIYDKSKSYEPKCWLCMRVWQQWLLIIKNEWT